MPAIAKLASALAGFLVNPRIPGRFAHFCSTRLEWHGWYSLRRGVATTLAGLTRDGMASKGLLRHTNLATTTRHYVKDVPENTLAAMNRLEALFNQCSTADAERPN
jgi:hypothetical protein